MSFYHFYNFLFGSPTQEDKVLCPMSERLLKMKDLIDITFTAIKDGDSKKAVIVKDVGTMKTHFEHSINHFSTTGQLTGPAVCGPPVLNGNVHYKI